MQRLTFSETKQLAANLGISHSPNIGEQKLAERIQEYAENENLDISIEIDSILNLRVSEDKKVVTEQPTNDKPIIRNFGDYTSKNEVKMTNQKMSQKQIRCIIHCNNPNKSMQRSEIFSVLNEFIPDETKPVPFGVPTHVSQALFDVIKNKKFTSHAPDKDKNPSTQFLPEYTIEILDPLTDEELNRIKSEQLARSVADMDDVI